MKKIISLLLGMCLFILPVFADGQSGEIFKIKVQLPDSALWSNTGSIFISDQEISMSDAINPGDGIVISFFSKGNVMRIGVKEPTCSGLQVRTELPISEIKDGTLEFRLNYIDGKYMMYVNDTAIANRNWNTQKPADISEGAWKTTDNIANCTDYSRLIGADSVNSEDNGKIDFLLKDLSKTKLHMDVDNIVQPFQVVETSFFSADVTSVLSSGRVANAEQSQAVILYVVIAGSLFVIIATALLAWMIIFKKKKNRSTQ